MQSIWDWLMGEAGAGWVVGLAGLCLGIYTWLRRERAPRVLVQEVKRTKLLDIHSSQRDRLSVFYTDDKGVQAPVQELEQKEIVIYNNGTKDLVEPLQLKLRFWSAGSSDRQIHGFWRWLFEDEGYSSIPFAESKSVDGRTEHIATGTSVELPYLNSYAVHRHYVRAYLISDGEIQAELWQGVGRGWSARFIALEPLKKWQRRASQIAVAASGVVALIGVQLMRTADTDGSLVGRLGLAILFSAFVLSWVGPPFAKGLCRRWMGARPPSEFAG